MGIRETLFEAILMVFTDDNLKRLKEYNLLNRALFDEFTMDQMKALLARLEAAERLIGWKCIDNPVYEKDLEAWRKSKGEAAGRS